MNEGNDKRPAYSAFIARHAAKRSMQVRYTVILKGLKIFLFIVDVCLLVGGWWYLQG